MNYEKSTYKPEAQIQDNLVIVRNDKSSRIY